MTYGIRVTLQADESLLFQCDNETRADLSHALKDNWQRAESDFIEMIRGDYDPGPGRSFTLEFLDPADIFAMTEMPMLADTVRDDDDAVRVYGAVWGFSDYCIRDYLTELAHKGRTIFEKVADFGDGVTFPSRFPTGTGATRAKMSAAADHLAQRVYENCNGGRYVIEQVPDIQGEPGDTIGRVVDYAMPAPPPTVGDLFGSSPPPPRDLFAPE